MPIIAKDNRREFTPAPEGLHQAVCVDVIDKGMQETPWGSKQKVEIRWQLEATDETTEKRFMVTKWYTLSLNEKATLRQHLEAWRGRKFTKDELEGFDLERLVGINCQVQIVHDISDKGGTFANLQAIVPLGKGMTKMIAKDYVRMIDRVAAGAPVVAEEVEDDEKVPF